MSKTTRNAFLLFFTFFLHQFLREAAIQGDQRISCFSEEKDPDKGDTSTAFYNGYVLCEKLRVAQNKPKSKDRLQMENLWSEDGGFNITTASNNRFV
jgi:hypothetical protein